MVCNALTNSNKKRVYILQSHRVSTYVPRISALATHMFNGKQVHPDKLQHVLVDREDESRRS